MTLCDPLEIKHTHADFRDWFLSASKELKRLDDVHYEILTNYFRRGNGEVAEIQRERELFDLRFELIGLKLASEAVWHVWKQHRDNMPIAGA